MKVPNRATDVRIHFFRTGQLNLCTIPSALVLCETARQPTDFLGRWAHPNQQLPHLGRYSDWHATFLFLYVAVHRPYLLLASLSYCHSMKAGHEQLVQTLACHVVNIKKESKAAV